MISKHINTIRQRVKKHINKLSLALTKRRSRNVLNRNKVIFGNNTFGNKFFIQNLGKIILGNDVYLNSFPNGSSCQTALNTYFPEAIISIGDNCRINGTIIHCNESVTIKKDCMFGPGTVIVDNDSHRISADYFERRKRPVSKPILIEENVWIGMNCIILKGVHIGKNAIVASG